MVQTESKLKIKQIIIPICNLRLKPNSNSDLETQLLFGEKVKIIREIKITGYYVNQLKIIILVTLKKNV